MLILIVWVPINSAEKQLTILIQTHILPWETLKTIINQGLQTKNKHRIYDTVSYHNCGAFLVGVTGFRNLVLRGKDIFALLQRGAKQQMLRICEAQHRIIQWKKKQRSKLLCFSFGRSDRIRTCDLVNPNKYAIVFWLLLLTFWCFLVRKRCFSMLSFALFPRSPKP